MNYLIVKTPRLQNEAEKGGSHITKVGSFGNGMEIETM